MSRPSGTASEPVGGQKSFCMSMTRRAEVDGLIEDMVAKAVMNRTCH